MVATAATLTRAGGFATSIRWMNGVGVVWIFALTFLICADIFARIAGKAGRTFWLNPEPRLYWNYGDSVIAAYEEHCEAHECWTTQQLEDFVKALAKPIT